MQKNSAAARIYDGFTASKIPQLIRHAVISPADFRRTNFQRRIRRSAAAEGSNCNYKFAIVHPDIFVVVNGKMADACSIKLQRPSVTIIINIAI